MYRAIFPEGNIGFINGPDRAEVVQVKAIVEYLKANPSHPMADRAAYLKIKVINLEDALAPASAAGTALMATFAVESEKRQALGRALRKSVGRLRAELMDEKKVNAFFPSVAEFKVPEDEPVIPPPVG